MVRYFAGDLDPVELRAFEMDLAGSALRRRVFAAEYDYRTRNLGMSALEIGDPDLSECFSLTTLDAFVRDRLKSQDHALVAQHLSCPICGAQVEAMRRDVARRARLGWWDWFEEGFGRMLGWVAQPVPIAVSAAAVLAVIATSQGPWTSEKHESASVYRSVGDGLAALDLRVASGGRPARAMRDGIRLSPDSRFRVLGRNLDPEYPRFFALFSVDAQGELTWHIPTWDGLVPPTMVQLPPGEEDYFRLEKEARLGPGTHRVVLLLNHTPANLERIRGQLTGRPDRDLKETFVDVLGRKVSLSQWQVEVGR